VNRKLRMLAFIIAATLLPGCWDFQEVSTLSFATTVGIDRGPGNRIGVTVQVPITQNALPPVAGGGETGKKFYMINLTAGTVNEAFDRLETRTDRTLVLNQNKSVIIGEAAARHDIKPLLDYLTRSAQAPLQALVFVTDGIAALDVLKLDPVQNILPGMIFINSGQSVTKSDEAFYIPLWQFQQKLIHSSKDAFAPLVRIDRAHRVHDISGLAVFNGNRLAGKLTPEETESFGLITGLSKAGLTMFSSPQGEITLRTLQAKSRLKVRLRQGKPFFEVHVVVFGSVSENTGGQLTIFPREIDSYQRAIEKEIREAITDLIKKLQAFNSDVINFGEEFRVQHQAVWQKTDWKAVYPTVPFAVKVKVRILSNGRFR
jgi:spore germination protein KC